MWPFSRKQPEPPEQKALGDDPEIYHLLSGSVPGSYAVTAAQALTVPAVASAVRVISEAAASLDVRVERAGHEVEHPIARLLQGDVNDWTSGFDLIRDIVAEALCSDLGGLAWVNRVNGEVREIIRYQPGAITVEYASDGSGEPMYRLAGKRIPSLDVIHLRGPFTRCALSLAREAIGLAKALERHAGGLFENGAKPGGIIETPKAIGDEGVKKMIRAWRAAHDGPANAGKTGILWDGASFKQLALNSTDAQFLENRRFQILEIARAFRVPPSMLYELERVTWSNGEQMGKEFLTYTLEPWLRALEACLSRALFNEEERKTHKIVFDRDDLTRADLGARATAYSSLITARVLNPNEAREWEGLPPYEGGNTFANPAIEAANDNTPKEEAA